MSYNLEGTLLEVCDCAVLCPCWIGEDPDGGTCDAIVAYHIEKGTINGIDVSGKTLALLGHIPGNILQGNWKAVMIVDDKADEQQQQAMLDVWTGKLGGPIADFAALIGEVVAIERHPISYEIVEGKGRITIGDIAEAEMEPYRSPAGNVTTLNESIFSSIPGSPAWVSKASTFVRKGKDYGLKDINISDHNAIQGTFSFAA